MSKHPLLETNPAPENVKREARVLIDWLDELRYDSRESYDKALFALCVNALRAHDSTEKDVGLRNRTISRYCSQCGCTYSSGKCTPLCHASDIRADAP